MKIIKLTTYLLFISFVMVSCKVEYKNDSQCDKLKYITFEELRNIEIKIDLPKDINNSGKIYIYNNILLINEKNKGIHIIDNSNKQLPINKAFINIIGNVDIAVKEGILYADSCMDMIVIDINDLNNIKVLQRKLDVFNYDNVNNTDNINNNLSDYCGYDLDKGIVIGVSK